MPRTKASSAAPSTASLRNMNRPDRWIPTTRPVSSEKTGEPEFPPSVEQSWNRIGAVVPSRISPIAARLTPNLLPKIAG